MIRPRIYAAWSFPFRRPWIRRRVYHRVCDSSRPTVTFPAIQSITVLWPVPIYTAWWTEAHVREAERPRVERATYWLQVRCPDNYATTPHSSPVSGSGYRASVWCGGVVVRASFDTRQLGPSTRVSKKCTRVHGPSTRPVNSGSGNRAFVCNISETWLAVAVVSHCWVNY